MAKPPHRLESVEGGRFDLDAFKINLALAGSGPRALVDLAGRIERSAKATKR
jgi:hypothetical protein